MEIPQFNDKINNDINKDINPCIELNNKLQKLYSSYDLYSQDVMIRDERKFIGSIYHNKAVILRIDYSILGSYSKDKNVWIWADQSQSINKSDIALISTLRTLIISAIDIDADKKFSNNEEMLTDIKKFCSMNYLVLPTSELCEYLNHISLLIADQIKGSILLTLSRVNIIDVIIAKKILFNNLKN